MARNVLWVVMAAWAICVFLGFFRFITLAPTDFGLTRGFNKIEAFVVWQLAAAALSIPAWLIGNRIPRSALRWLSRLPMLWVLLLALAVLALFAWSWYQHLLYPPQSADPGPVTAPIVSEPVAPVAQPPALE